MVVENRNTKFGDTKFLFKLQKIPMKLIGFWPGDDNVSLFAIILTVFHALFIFVAVGFEFNFAYVNINNLALVLDCLTPTITKLVTAIKILIILYYRKRVKYLLDILEERFKNNKDEDSTEINATMSKYSYMFTLCIGISSNLTCFFFVALPVFKNVYFYFAGKDFIRDLPFKAVFWFDSSISPYYQLAYIGLSYSAYLTIGGFTALDGLFVGFCIHLAGQFEIIKTKIKRLKILIMDNEKLTPVENEKIFSTLTKLVDDHNFIIDLCSEMSEIFSSNILVHYVSASFVICICSLSIMLAQGADKLIFINYIVAATSQVLAYSVGGSYLGNSSHRIKYAAYDFPWYKCNIKVRKAMLMIIQRADRETAISVPFFKANIETFGSIMSAAMSYITLLKTFL